MLYHVPVFLFSDWWGFWNMKYIGVDSRQVLVKPEGQREYLLIFMGYVQMFCKSC